MGRAVLTKTLITGKDGMLDQMTEMTYPEQKGRHPEMGEEIEALAGKLDE